MSDQKTQIKKYLQDKVNPILKPLVEAIAKERPKDIFEFIVQYAQKQTQAKPKVERKDSNDTHLSTEKQLSRQEADAIQKKIQAKIQKKGKKVSALTRKGISAQVFGSYNKKSAFTPKVHEKSKQSIEFLKGLLKKSIMFQGLSEENFEIIINAVQEVKCEVQKQIIKQGDAGDMLYVIGSGEYECTKIINGKETYLKTYKPGELFGELSLMYNAKRAASIKCSKAGTIFALDRLTFMNIVQESATKKREEYEKAIGQIEILSDIHDYEKQQLCDTLKQERYEPNDYVVKEGDDGDRLYFVIDGNLVAEKLNTKTNKMDIVFKYKQKQYFGEIALMKNTVRQASVKAVTRCKLLSISRDEFKRLLGPIENILSRNMEKYHKFMNKA